VLSSGARPGPATPRLTVCDLGFDLAARVVKRACETVQLSAKEYELLVAWPRIPSASSRREELLRNVWGFRSLGRTRTLDSHASRVRRKLSGSTETAYACGRRLPASRQRLGLEHDLPEGLALLDEAVCLGRLRERQLAVHDRAAELALRHELDQVI
jgi:hypothetical protein